MINGLEVGGFILGKDGVEGSIPLNSTILLSRK